MKIITWDKDKTKEEVGKRYKNASEYRSYLEDRWIRNERSVYSQAPSANLNYLEGTIDGSYYAGMSGVDNSDTTMNVSYTFKNVRFIHAQMSSNPPAVAMRPTSSDQSDHRKADAADMISRWAMRAYKLQEKSDQRNLHTLVYGTGFMKSVWDSTKGDPIEFDPTTNEMKLEGDITITVPFIWNIYIDPDAKSWDEVKYIMEKVYMDYEEACARWPDKLEELKKARIGGGDTAQSNSPTSRQSLIRDAHYNSVELLEYWETGLPTNGYVGRFCITTTDGTEIEPVRPSPFRFRTAGAVSAIEESDLPDDVKEAKIRRVPEQARLPYDILTDVDTPNMIYGRSAVEYSAQLQDNLNKLDTAVLDNIQAHGVARLVLPATSEISDDSLSTSPWDVIKVSGPSGQQPYFVGAPQLMSEMTSTRENLIKGIDDVMGVNESMFGQQSREQSGASMQYATNQGNMVRRRLFNKYVLSTESLYMNILDLVRKHWTTSRTIRVIGEEKALESIDLKGADIDGGYDVIGEYGTTLSLDPITRREEILQLQPLFEKAGVSPRTSMRLLKLNDLSGMFDALDLAENRQKEIFDEMIAKNMFIEPKKFRDHENMIAWALNYFMSQEFNTLREDQQALCEAHIERRAQLAAEEKSGVDATAINPTSAPAPNGEIPAAPAPAGPPAGAAGPVV